METGSLILVVMVEPPAISYSFRRKRMDWPLHITLIPWFKTVDEQAVIESIKRALGAIPSFELTVGSDTMFGETSVSLIADPEPIVDLHNVLLETVAQNVVFSQMPNWIGNEYQPHITHHDDSRLADGQKVTVKDVTVVRLLPNNICQVVDIMELQ